MVSTARDGTPINGSYKNPLNPTLGTNPWPKLLSRNDRCFRISKRRKGTIFPPGLHFIVAKRLQECPTRGVVGATKAMNQCAANGHSLRRFLAAGLLVQLKYKTAYPRLGWVVKAQQYRNSPRNLDRLIHMVALLALIFTSGCSDEIRYRYKLTLSFDADGTVHTSSNVVEFRRWLEPATPIAGAAWKFAVNGEGNYIDLGRGRNLVALLTKYNATPELGIPKSNWSGYSPETVLLKAYGLPLTGNLDSRAPYLRELVTLRGARKISPGDLPELVTFPDPLNPKSAKVADPSNLNDTVGPGVTFQRATIEITRDPISRNLANHLPWINGPTVVLSGRKSAISDTSHFTNFVMNRDFKRDF